MISIRMVKTALLLFILMTLICGVVYPIVVTLIASVLFPWQAHGSLITDNNGYVTGSALIGMNITDPAYFRGRPSVTAGHGYNPLSSGGSNLGPMSPVLIRTVSERVSVLKKEGLDSHQSDLVTASASGLDPHITVETALSQIDHIITRRSISRKDLQDLIQSEVNKEIRIYGPQFVNLNSLNRELDKRASVI